MVKLGFIVEGASEKIILEHSDFFRHLDSLSLSYIPEVIDAQGNGNLLPHNITRYTKILEEKGATVIFILTDLDDDECIISKKKLFATQWGQYRFFCWEECLANKNISKYYLRQNVTHPMFSTLSFAGVFDL